MATRTITVVTDDLDQSTDGVRTHRFVFDGVEYEIDLSPTNFAHMREALAPYLTAGRRLPKRPAARRTGPVVRTSRSSGTQVRDHKASNPDLPRALPRQGHSPIAQAVRDPFAGGTTPAGHADH
ncbi:Lsr2 family protein [Micromonospora craterilacus]|uniref:Lsr2 family protein n=1 Tax=Micromonospora craterilacus TaxID=1655439 RepID=A0A2W2ECM7_9ACTN|nr:Lsr2 family protein [Micromonospora craterilacus]PZG09668.1 Lsr2 family protein [Micromonospora craterilacus]